MKKYLKMALLGIMAIIGMLFMLAVKGTLVDYGILKDKNEDPQVTVTYEYNPKQMEKSKKSISDSDYQDTLQLALEKGRKDLDDETMYQKNIDEVIKRIENEEYILLYFRSVKNKKQECLTMAKFKKKEIDGKEKYYFLLCYPTEDEKNAWYIGNFKDDIEGLLVLSDYMQDLNINPSKGRFIYGDTRFEEIYDLKIEGQRPTEIIPYKSFGKQWYFWYYENLESDKVGSQLEFTY